MADPDEEKTGRLQDRLDSLESRITRIEAALGSATYSAKIAENTQSSEDSENIHSAPEPDTKDLESSLGGYGFAWMGNVVLLFGIIFMTIFLVNTGHKVLSVTIGYLSASLIFFFAWYLKQSNSYLSFILRINAQVLLFCLTLRLHYFTDTPVLADKTTATIFLLFITIFQVYLAVRDRTQVFAVLAVIFTLITGLASDSGHLLPVLVILSAAGSFYLFYLYRWQALVIIAALTCYISLFLWLLGNPVAGHPAELDKSLHSVVYYAGALGMIFSLLLLFRNKDLSSGDFLIGITFVNGSLFTMLLAFFTAGFLKDDYVVLYSILSVFCLIFSICLHWISDWNFGSAFYALYGFMAMSIAFYGLNRFPGVCLFLSIQSLIVVSMALWFRNRLIIVMNSLLFLSIIFIYLAQSRHDSTVNFSFALVSFISARVINWKKERLQIKTDLIRNLYMIEGFIMMLYALFHAVPKQYITLSWALAALVYFFVGSMLKNIKYRYLSLGTLICAALYFFIVDLAKIDIIYRVMALLLLAAISIGISMYYSLHLNKTDKKVTLDHR